jgi:ATP-dependent Clp protease adaptor protein ClpS
MSTFTKEQTSTQIEEILSKPYKLTLHNDDYNTFEHVINCLMKYCNHGLEQANQCAHIVHFVGKCDVKHGDHNTINKMYDKLKSNGLTVTIELV